MKFKTIRAAAVLFLAVALFTGNASADISAVSAKHAIIMDAASHRVIWERRSNERALIASTTKIMTGLLVVQECDLQSWVQIPEDAVGIEGSSIYLNAGEILKVEDLLYGMMLHSGNDAAVALALYCGGNMDSFVAKMNEKARELELYNTKFANPHGLDSPDNYSTACDMAKLAAYAMSIPAFREVVSTQSFSCGSRTFTNHNKLLWQYPGAIGVKTGYTKAAGRILVSCAEQNGRRLIVVTISDPNDWVDHRKMLDYGFSAFQDHLLTVKDTMVRVPVVGGAEEIAIAEIRENIKYPLTREEKLTVQYHLPRFVYPPILGGDRAGELVVLIDGCEIDRIPLYWRYSVLEGA